MYGKTQTIGRRARPQAGRRQMGRTNCRRTQAGRLTDLQIRLRKNTEGNARQTPSGDRAVPGCGLNRRQPHDARRVDGQMAGRIYAVHCKGKYAG